MPDMSYASRDRADAQTSKDRIARVERATKETTIAVDINLDGTGKADIQTGVPFFDHMLQSFANHSLIDLTIHASGDTEIDSHHTVEDTAICIGEALRAAGVLYRAVVEELVKDQGGTGKDLFHQIDSLQGRLEEDLLEDLHESRVIGNESVHHGVTFETEEIGDLASALQEACRVLYEVPAQRQRYRAQRAARVQARKGKR